MKAVLRELRAIWLSLGIFHHIDGERRAATAAFHSLLALACLAALLPLALLSAGRPSPLAARLAQALPTEAAREGLARALAAYAEVPVAVVAPLALGLLWGALRVYQTLAAGTARAWGNRESRTGLRRPADLFTLAALHSALFLGVVLPSILHLLADSLRRLAPALRSAYDIGLIAVPLVALVHGLATLYAHTPRNPTSIARTWIPALAVSIPLAAAPTLLQPTLLALARLGPVAGPIALFLLLLLWAQVGACLALWGACLTAARERLASRSRRRPRPRTAPPAPQTPARPTQLEFDDVRAPGGKV